MPNSAKKCRHSILCSGFRQKAANFPLLFARVPAGQNFWPEQNWSMKSGRQIVIVAAFIFLIVSIAVRGQTFSLLSAPATNSWGSTDTNALTGQGQEEGSWVNVFSKRGYPLFGEAVADSNSTFPHISGTNIIPLIEFVDVPLTVALENLARAAGMNYLLDPWIEYDKDGLEKIHCRGCLF
jgi:hypothetical protein